MAIWFGMGQREGREEYRCEREGGIQDEKRKGGKEEKERGGNVQWAQSGGQWRMGTRRDDDGNGVQFLAFSFTTAVTCKKIKLHYIIIFYFKMNNYF